MSLLGSLWEGAKVIGKSILRSFNPFKDESYKNASREEQDTFKSKVEVIANDPNLDHEYRMEAQKVLAQIESYRHAEELARIEGTTQITIAQIQATKEVIVAKVGLLQTSIEGARQKELALITAVGNSPELASSFLERLDASTLEVKSITEQLTIYSGELVLLSKQISEGSSGLLLSNQPDNAASSICLPLEDKEVNSCSHDDSSDDEWIEFLWQWEYDNDLNVFPKDKDALIAIEELNLFAEGVRDFPKELCNLTNLKKLDLQKNKVSSLPKEIGNLVNLTHLDLRRNSLNEIPKELSNLTALKELDLYGNYFSEIPRELGVLTNLEFLWVSKSRVKKYPRTLENCIVLSK